MATKIKKENSATVKVNFKTDSAIWVDGFTIGARKDGLVTISALQQNPNNTVNEQVRLIMLQAKAEDLVKHLNRMIASNKSS